MDVRRPYILGMEDEESPETFQPEIAQDPAIFNGKWFLVFATQDKGSGIDYYETKETRSKKLGTWITRWKVVGSPHVLRDQELRSHIIIKAVDKDGNERIEALAPQNPLAWYENYENWSIIIIIGFAIAYVIGTRIKGHAN